MAALIALVLAFSAGCTSVIEPTPPQSRAILTPQPSSTTATEPATPTDPPNTNKMLDLSQRIADNGDEYKAWADTSRKRTLEASTLVLTEAFIAKPNTEQVDIVAPLGKHCFILLRQNPKGSTTYEMNVLTRYSAVYSTGFMDSLELADLKNEVEHWKYLCTIGRYQPMPGEQYHRHPVPPRNASVSA